ncbi:tyrosine-tyramine antiporter [Latilactobacillus curvatus]|uniref:tyrosine-tyramine antiporter n=1 Tax=Latilactobacillus curvatus TaxID=28038 RepID=UPI0011DDD53A|nr:tyrosine-tyramine antiporter [Latilactobacillus curvatus]
MENKQVNKIALGTFIGLTMALCATVRSIPTLAATGWAQISYSIFAVLFFALPIALIAGELGTAMPEEGGPQLWIKTALSSKLGFVAAWLLWVQMFPGMVMVASTIGPLLGNSFGNPTLGNNHWFVLGCILVFYWIITLLNLKYDMAKVGGNIGVWLGVYIPIVIMAVMGIAALIKNGIMPGGTLGHFSMSKLIPTKDGLSSLKYMAGISFIFTGIEMSSVFIPRLHNPSKTFTKGIFVSLIGLVVLNLVNAMLVANVVPMGKMELSNITQPILIYCQILGWPTMIANIFSFMVFIGVLLQLSAWVTGPSKTIIQVARDGYLPAKLGFHKQNQYGVSKNVVLTQTIAISLFALLYGFMKDVNGVFLTLTNATTILYAIVYLLIAVAVLKLRKDQPDLDRPYRIGKKGNGLVWTVSIALILGIAIIAFATLFTTSLSQSLLVVIISVIFTIIPFIISKYKNDQWLIDIQKDMQQK